MGNVINTFKMFLAMSDYYIRMLHLPQKKHLLKCGLKWVQRKCSLGSSGK